MDPFKPLFHQHLARLELLSLLLASSNYSLTSFFFWVCFALLCYRGWTQKS